MPILEVRNIEKHFGGTRVLEDISFELEQGQALAIIGSSGSGKTTLLRCLNFLEKPDRGTIAVRDSVVFDADDPATQQENEVRKKRLHFGLVFQSFNLFPQYTALRNVTLAKELLAREQPDFKARKKEILEQIVQIAREHELIIFSDEIYDRLIMDGYKHTSIASLAPDVFCVTFSGLSKSHMIAGFRIGWMILSGAKNKAKGYIEGINMLSSMRLCSNVPAQSIVQTALGGYQSVNEYIQPGGRVYEQRDFIYKALNDIPGITAVKPKAAFYIFPKIDTEKFNIHNDEQFALDFLHEKQVLLVPGKGFNWNCPDHFRVVYLPNVRQLEKAMDKLKDFLSTYKQR